MSLRFAVVNAVFDVGEKMLNFLDGNQIADVLRVLNQAKHQANQFAVGYRRAAAVAEIERGVDLDAQAGGLVVVVGELDARDDALGYRELRAAGRIAVDVDVVFDPRQFLGEG